MSHAELNQLLQQSKQDTTRILILYEIGRIYLKQVNSDKKNYMMDTAIDIFSHALRLSDTLHSKGFWYESMLLVGEACFHRGYIDEGKKRFLEVAAIYHDKGDLQREARTWVRLARKMDVTDDRIAYIDSCFNKALKLYQQAHNVEKEGATWTYLSDYLFYTGRTKQGELALQQGLDLYNKAGSKDASYNYYRLSEINRYRGSYEKSLLYARKCVENGEHGSDTFRLDYYYGELALVLDELGRPGESSYWYRKALDRRLRARSDKVVIFRTAGLLIRQMIELGKSREALALVDSLVTIYAPNTPSEKTIAAQDYAYCFYALKNYPEAEKHFLAMISYYADAPKNDEYSSIVNMDIGRYYLQRQQFIKAHRYLDTAVVYAPGGRLLTQRELYQMLFIADSALKNYPAAVKDLQQYQVVNDSIFNETKSRQIEELTIQYETEKKEQSIRLLEQESRLQKSALKQFRYTTSWVLGVTVLLIIITGLAINYSRLKQRTNNKLRVQQRQIESKNKSLQRLVEEKEWLVKEIHHRVKNNFHIVMGLLRTQSEYLEGPEAIQAITQSGQRIQAMSLIHQKLYQSDNLSSINMADYIHELIDYLQESIPAGSQIQFKLQVDAVKLHVSCCIPLGLILNEAITNALKYAFPVGKTGIISVVFSRAPVNQFILIIKDNGIGLPPDFDGQKSASMGMKLMRGLSDDIDATFSIKSNPGTEIALRFSCDDDAYSLASTGQPATHLNEQLNQPG